MFWHFTKQKTAGLIAEEDWLAAGRERGGAQQGSERGLHVCPLHHCVPQPV